MIQRLPEICYGISIITAIAALQTACIWNRTEIEILAYEIGFILFVIIAYVSIKIGDP